MATWLKEDFAEAVLKLTAFGLNQRARQKYMDNANGWARSRAMLKTRKPGTVDRLLAQFDGSGLPRCTRKIDIPAMLVYGGESNFYRVETAHHVAKQMPNAILHIYEETNHSPHQWHRERFTSDLITFIDQPA